MAAADGAAGFEEDEAPGLSEMEVVTKYKLAGEMANRVLRQVQEACVPGATIISLCTKGDELILKETSTVYTKKVEGKVVPKGVAFPTCISVNHCICHNSPLVSDPEGKTEIKDGDVVKIDLGVHLGGYIACAATTIVVGASADKPVTGKAADVMTAAHTAAEVAVRMCKPGAKTEDITKAIASVAAAYGVTPVEGMLSHRLERNIIDGEKAVIQNPTEEQKRSHKESVVEVNEVYLIDIFMSTGDGKPREGEQRSTVFKKTDNSYHLKMKAARTFFSEVQTKFTDMPFSLRMCEDEVRARLGVGECVNHGVVQPYELMWEQKDEFVAQYKALVLLMPNGNMRVTWGDLDTSVIKSEKKLEDKEMLQLLQTSVSSKSKKKKKKAKKPTEGAAAAK